MSLSNPFERLIFIFGFVVFSKRFLGAEFPEDVAAQLTEMIEFALLVMFFAEVMILCIHGVTKAVRWGYAWVLHRRYKAINQNARD